LSYIFIHVVIRYISVQLFIMLFSFLYLQLFLLLFVHIVYMHELSLYTHTLTRSLSDDTGFARPDI